MTRTIYKYRPRIQQWSLWHGGPKRYNLLQVIVKRPRVGRDVSLWLFYARSDGFFGDQGGGLMRSGTLY